MDDLFPLRSTSASTSSPSSQLNELILILIFASITTAHFYHSDTFPAVHVIAFFPSFLFTTKTDICSFETLAHLKIATHQTGSRKPDRVQGKVKFEKKGRYHFNSIQLQLPSYSFFPTFTLKDLMENPRFALSSNLFCTKYF